MLLDCSALLQTTRTKGEHMLVVGLRTGSRSSLLLLLQVIDSSKHARSSAQNRVFLTGTAGVAWQCTAVYRAVLLRAEGGG